MGGCLRKPLLTLFVGDRNREGVGHLASFLSSSSVSAPIEGIGLNISSEREVIHRILGLIDESCVDSWNLLTEAHPACPAQPPHAAEEDGAAATGPMGHVAEMLPSKGNARSGETGWCI